MFYITYVLYVVQIRHFKIQFIVSFTMKSKKNTHSNTLDRLPETKCWQRAVPHHRRQKRYAQINVSNLNVGRSFVMLARVVKYICFRTRFNDFELLTAMLHHKLHYKFRRRDNKGL